MRKPPSTRVMEIFSEAATSDAARRAAYLDLVCGSDAELRAEVESLLATQQRVERFLDGKGGLEAVAGVGDSDAQGWPGPDVLECGSAVVGRYTIVERIGEGGFGVVYCARQERPIRRDVALKIVKLGMDTRQIIRRFESERQALALMDHPNIARIYDAGATPEGRPYFAMELVHGSPVTDYCDTEKLTIPQRLELFTQVCNAVQHAHQKGIIHRDLKPSNILVALVDGKPVPKVIDFGIAKAIAARPVDQTSYTESRHFVGTPEYMSPEQAGAGDVDTRSDIYALGVLLYELLTGVTPLDRKVMREASLDRVHQVIREQEPPRPSARLSGLGPTLADVAGRRALDGARLRRTVAGELDWIVGKALEKDRSRRYDTAGALQDDVRRYLAHEPLLAGPPDTLYKVRKFTRRHRGPLLATAAVAVALLMGLAGTTFGLVRARHDSRRAEIALAQAEQVSDFLADMMRSADPDRAKGNQVLVRDVLDKATRNIDQGALKDQPLVEAGIRLAMAGAYSSLGYYAQSEAHARKAVEIRERLLGPDSRETARALSQLSLEVGQLRDLDAAEAMQRRALAIFERTVGTRHREYVIALSRLGTLLRSRRTPEGLRDREQTLRRAVELSAALPGDSDVKSSARTNLGVFLLEKLDLDGAEKLFAEALALDRAAHGEMYRNVARNLSNLAGVRQCRGDFAGAEAYWRQALKTQRAILPPNHQDTAWTLRLLGVIRFRQNDLAGAEKFLRDAMEMETKALGPNDLLVAMVSDNLADVVQAAGRRDEAFALRRRNTEIRLNNELEALRAHPDVVSHLGTAADLYVRRGEFDKARQMLDEAARRDPNDPQRLMVAACLRYYVRDEPGYREACAAVLRRFADTTDAEDAAWAARACALSPKLGGDADLVAKLAGRGYAGSQTPFSRLSKGLIELRAGHPDLAERCLKECLGSNPSDAHRAAAGFYLSEALRLKGEAAGAAAAMEKASEVFNRLPKMEDGDVGTDPEEWMFAQIAAREARAGSGAAPPPADHGSK